MKANADASQRFALEPCGSAPERSVRCPLEKEIPDFPLVFFHFQALYARAVGPIVFHRELQRANRPGAR